MKGIVKEKTKKKERLNNIFKKEFGVQKWKWRKLLSEEEREKFVRNKNKRKARETKLIQKMKKITWKKEEEDEKRKLKKKFF